MWKDVQLCCVGVIVSGMRISGLSGGVSALVFVVPSSIVSLYVQRMMIVQELNIIVKLQTLVSKDCPFASNVCNNQLLVCNSF